MRIIILGASQVGFTLAADLSTEGHDIVVVSEDRARLRTLHEHHDIRIVQGNPSFPNVLRQARADNADLLIAVTDSDEVNMVACQVAYSLFDVPIKIARIRSQHYLIRDELFGNDNLPIDVFIAPERLIADRIYQLIQHPGATQVVDFAEGRIKLLAGRAAFGGRLIGAPITELPALVGPGEAQVVAIFRGDRPLTLTDDTCIEMGDEVYATTLPEHVDDVLACLRPLQPACHRVIIVGGGHVGGCLAELLATAYRVKIIERSDGMAMQLSEDLEHVTVLHGDAADKHLLINENIEHTDVFCALTDDDETNILSALLAKKLGARQVISLISRSAYVDMLDSESIDIVLSPQRITIGSILAHIRTGDIQRVYALRGGRLEALEAVVHGSTKTSRLVGRRLAGIRLPKGVTFGAVLRAGQVLFPGPDCEVRPRDHLIVLSTEPRQIRSVEKLLSVKFGFF